MPGQLDVLVEKLSKALDGDLISVILYGSAAIGDQDEKFSDYNVLCVLKGVAPEHLASSESIFRWWRDFGNPSPLLLSEQEVRTSTDCFAIEFSDMKEHHRVLFGADVIASLEVDRSFHRAQVEHELRSKLLRVRQKAAGILSDRDALCILLADSVSTFCVLFRHALILGGIAAPATKREIIESARAAFGIDAAPFLRLLDHREQKIKTAEVDPRNLLGSYLLEIGKVIEAVDKMEKT
jgi:hypothetical protein